MRLTFFFQTHKLQTQESIDKKNILYRIDRNLHLKIKLQKKFKKKLQFAFTVYSIVIVIVIVSVAGYLWHISQPIV